MNKLKPILIGIGIGIVILIGIELFFGINFVGKVKDDYQDDVQSVINMAKESDEAVFQVDYLLAGLLLSEDFQMYLEEGVEKGWWTEEFLTQQFLDELLPIYGSEFKFVIDGIKSTKGAQKLALAIQKIKPIIQNLIQNLNKDQINALLTKLRSLRDKLLSIDISQIKALANKVENLISQLKIILPQIKHSINSLTSKINELIKTIKNLDNKVDDLVVRIKELINKIQELANKIDSLADSELVKSIEKILDAYKDGTLDDTIKGLIITGINNIIGSIDWNKVKEAIINAIKSSETINEAIDKIESIITNVIDKINTAINNLITKINNLIAKINELIDRINDILNSPVITSIKALIEAYKNGTLDDAIKDKIVNSEIGQKIINAINNINSITWEEVKQFILDAINDSSLGNAIDNIINNINNTIDSVEEAIDALLQDVVADFDFNTVANEDGFVVLPDGTQISAKLLNALDIEITGVNYSNSGTPLNMNDDTLTMNQIAIGFESLSDKIYIATGSKQITGSACITIKAIIPIINSTI